MSIVIGEFTVLRLALDEVFGNDHFQMKFHGNAIGDTSKKWNDLSNPGMKRLFFFFKKG